MIEVHGKYLGPGSFNFCIELDVPDILEWHMSIDESDILIEKQLREDFPDKIIKEGYIHISSWNKIKEEEF